MVPVPGRHDAGDDDAGDDDAGHEGAGDDDAGHEGPGDGDVRPARRAGRQRWLGRVVVVAILLSAGRELLVHGGEPSYPYLMGAWQLIDLETLGSDPLGSLLHLHIQPPLHNLLVGIVLWLPLPVVGTLLALYVACLVACGLFLQAILANWSVPPVAAGVIAGLATASPTLLDTIRLGGYEVPTMALLAAGLWAAQRHLRSPSGRWLVVASVLFTCACLTRALLHPLWLFAVVALLAVARRVPRRSLAVAVMVPVVLVGGWALKNQVMFGSPSLSSWTGFNLQRGVVAPMERDAVRADVAAGEVSPLALEPPWQVLDGYEEFLDGCEADHSHPAASREVKPNLGGAIANFNHECYLPLYGQASDDALALIARHPGRYLSTRKTALAISFLVVDTCNDHHGCTWMDALYDPVLGVVEVKPPMDDWNHPFFGQEHLTLRLSLVMPVLVALVLGRGGLAAVRLARAATVGRGGRGRRHRGFGRGRGAPAGDVPEKSEAWEKAARAGAAGAGSTGLAARAGGTGWRALPADEVLWACASWTVVVVILVGDLVEMGENNRFRGMVDPLVTSFVLAGLVRATRSLVRRARGNGRAGYAGGG